jgi:hypothetical protein
MRRQWSHLHLGTENLEPGLVDVAEQFVLLQHDLDELEIGGKPLRGLFPKLGRVGDEIEAITGRNPLHFEDRVALAVAMWAWRT